MESKFDARIVEWSNTQDLRSCPYGSWVRIPLCASFLFYNFWSHSVVVSTEDFESSNLGSSPSETFYF
jgi:hypothetical protein